MAADTRSMTSIVTGAAGVLGEAITRDLIAHNCRVAMIDVNADRLAALASEFGDAATAELVDLSDADAVALAIERIAQQFGGIDILINNAGILSNNKATETDFQEWRKVLAINLDGAFLMARAVLPVMRARQFGRIVNICSLAMKTGGLTAGTAYTVSKSALGGLTFSLARETAREGITVNGVAPAYILTPMVTEQLSEAQRQKLLEDIPVGRFCEASEVARLVSFLAAPESGFITGEIIDINGGLHFD